MYLNLYRFNYVLEIKRLAATINLMYQDSDVWLCSWNQDVNKFLAIQAFSNVLFVSYLDFLKVNSEQIECTVS